MARFRRKPVEIEALQFTESDKDRVFHWITCTKDAGFDEDGSPTLTIQTLEGGMRASLGDWIIKGVKGEFYPCKPDVFAQIYEEVSNG